MTRNMTTGNVTRSLLLFSLPLIAGNLLQQLYNVADTLIVGRFLGPIPLAAVGSSYTVMVFLTSANLGFCMGSGAVFSQLFGAGREEELKSALVNAFYFVGLITVAINLVAYLALDRLLALLNIQPEVLRDAKSYLQIVLAGMGFTFLFNFLAAALRSIGNSLVPLLFLTLASLLNIGLDLLFVLPLNRGVAGAALATVIAQGFSALGVLVYFLCRAPQLRPARRHLHFQPSLLAKVIHTSLLTSVQQSVMNLGILLVQGLVNSFGVAAMAAFSAAVKIDSFAYMPAQDFGNAFSTFVAQNHGAGQNGRIRRGLIRASALSAAYCAAASLLILLLAPWLMACFTGPGEEEIVAIGAQYLRIEGLFYPLIGLLFLLYGLYRSVGRPGMSVVLTAISLGTRVFLAYAMAPFAGLTGIWWAIPIGWLLADATGFGYYWLKQKNKE